MTNASVLTGVSQDRGLGRALLWVNGTAHIEDRLPVDTVVTSPQKTQACNSFGGRKEKIGEVEEKRKKQIFRKEYTIRMTCNLRTILEG